MSHILDCAKSDKLSQAVLGRPGQVEDAPPVPRLWVLGGATAT
jgi:hypothetical protein